MSKINILQIGSDNFKIGGVANQINLIKKIDEFQKIYKTFYLTRYKKKNNKYYFNINYNLSNFFFKIIYLVKFIKDKKINIVHAHTQRAGFLILLIKLINKNIKFVYQPHGLRHRQKKNVIKIFHYLLEIFILKSSNISIAITNKEKIFFRNKKINYSFIKNCLLVCKNRTLLKNLKKKKKFIIMVGSVNSIKQPKLFLKIAKKIIGDHINENFLWIGKINNYQKKKYNSISKNIKFINFINQKNLYKYYYRSKFMLFTSKYETYSSVISEALMIGLPIISNNFKGIDEFSNYKIIKFKYNDVNDAVKKIKKFLKESQNIKKKTKYSNVVNSLKSYLLLHHSNYKKLI